ncbi:MAG: pyridoxal-phosphate dependent enzyme [Saprospiraceae bacterium]|nr:pyridoxal-phosphate dependent enzyme [Saprospiraceae bacterium]
MYQRMVLSQLFHGPTLAFKDFGARFMAQTMSVLRPKDTEINILVATSGDTGGAVASAFSGLEAFKVFILFPKVRSVPYNKDVTTWEDNVQAIEVDGTFDDCQDWSNKLLLTRTFGTKSI